MFKHTAIILLATGGLMAIPAQAQEPSNFGGLKVGAVVGYDNVSLEYEDLDSDKSGVLYGITAGYDLDLGRAVVGVELEAADSSTREYAYDLIYLGDSLKRAAGRDLYVGARVGVPVSSGLLAYAKGGYTNARTKLTYDDGAGSSASDSDTLGGWRLGGGVEIANAGSFARLEYRYSDYGDYKVDGFSTGLSQTRQQVALTGGFRF